MGAAIALEFRGVAGRFRTADAEAFRLEEALIVSEPDNRPIAEYDERHWRARGRYFVRWNLIGEAVMRCENRSGTSIYLGRFNELHGVDGSILSGQKLIARWAEADAGWLVYPLEMLWPLLRLLAQGRQPDLSDYVEAVA